jgi:HAMP domain-containing protein
MGTAPYFSQLIALDGDGALAAYPTSKGAGAPLKNRTIALARGGAPAQTYAILPESSGGPARIAFMAADQASGAGGRVLLARAALAENPVSQPFITTLEGVEGLGGQGMLIDENGRAIYHTEPALTMSPYLGQTAEEAMLYDDTAPDGTRTLVYYQPVPGGPWAVALTVPAQVAQQLALGIAAPLSLMVLVLAVAALVFLRVGLRGVTLSLRSLAKETERIAGGDLDHSLPVSGVDEVGQLTGSFEQMRGSLRARLEELNRLLAVSQGVASSLDLDEAVRPVLDAALATGASAVRMVVVPAAGLGYEPEGPSRFGAGPAQEAYAYLDDDDGLGAGRQGGAFHAPSRARVGLNPLASSLLRDSRSPRHENRFTVCCATTKRGHSRNRCQLSFDRRGAALAAANAPFLSACGRERLRHPELHARSGPGD